MLPTEIFGPVVTVVKADDFENALHLANASPFGLSVFYTNDRLEAYRFKTGIKAGMTGINNSLRAEAHLPFGGVKDSGNGTRESGIWVIEAYSYWHAVNDELFGKLQLAQMDVMRYTSRGRSRLCFIGLEHWFPTFRTLYPEAMFPHVIARHMELAVIIKHNTYWLNYNF